MVVPTAYFPTPAWLIAIQNGAVVEAHEHFQKQTSRNRCSILTANGVLPLVVPCVHQSGRKIPIQDVRIDYTEPWQRTHRRAVEAAYRSSPFWEHFQEKITPLFALQEQFLWDLNEQIAEQLLHLLKLHAPINHTTQFRGASTPPTIETAYVQVFSDRIPFTSGLSALDSIFCQAQLPNAE